MRSAPSTCAIATPPDLLQNPEVSVDQTILWISAFALAFVLSASAGLRAWLPLLMVGTLVRAEWLEIGKSFEFLGSTFALAVFGIATVIEIAADKIPAIDHAVDTVSTVLRPLSGSLLAAAAFSAVEDPVFAIVLGIVIGGPTAAVPHFAKSATRVASSVTTMGIANPILSVIEDVLSFVLVILGLVIPVVALLAVILVAVWVLRRRPRPPVISASASGT